LSQTKKITLSFEKKKGTLIYFKNALNNKILTQNKDLRFPLKKIDKNEKAPPKQRLQISPI